MIDQILTQLHTISIHALREESDFEFGVWRPFRVYFNPRSP